MLLLLFSTASAQMKPQQKFKETELLLQKDSLVQVFGKNKKIPEEYLPAFYAAVQYYPELQNTRIKFKSKNLKSTMAARPAFGSMLRSKKNRKYVVYVNTKTNNGNPLYSDFTFNAKVGLIGHELAHIFHYTETGFFPLVKEGIKYRKESYKATYERATDSITIVRGLGWQVYDFTSQLHALPSVPDWYKAYKLRVYFSPKAVLALMSDLGYEF